jgi:dTDP-4-dehydrorhamnose 3,5-epimerase
MIKPIFIPTKNFTDQRGLFMKHDLECIEIDFNLKDYFVTRSSLGVLRGIHWQSGPCATNRIVTNVIGRILDVTIDMRKDSTDYGKTETWTLSEDSPGFLFIPKGFAHGYQVLSNESVIAYLTDGKYCPEHDRGILWSSIGIEWPIRNPIISDRDRSFLRLDDFSFGSKES